MDFLQTFYANHPLRVYAIIFNITVAFFIAFFVGRKRPITFVHSFIICFFCGFAIGLLITLCYGDNEPINMDLEDENDPIKYVK